MSGREPFTSRRRGQVGGDGTPEDTDSSSLPPASEPAIDTIFTSSGDVPTVPADDAPGDVVPDPPEPPEDRRRGGWASLLRELPVLILIAFVLAFLLRTFVVQVFYIPSSSMEPTLQVNDRILVDKVTYRVSDLSRGDIVVFEGDHVDVPDAGAVDTVLRGIGQVVGVVPANARDFVKRVVGLPGDEIHIDDEGTVTVNGEVLDEPYLGQRDPRSCGPLVVPEGQLFFLGDNRANSSDSRAGLGFVAVDHVVGRAFLTIWPVDRVHLLDRPDYPGVADPPGTAPPPESADGDICDPG
jgi:signal peptidase I